MIAMLTTLKAATILLLQRNQDFVQYIPKLCTDTILKAKYNTSLRLGVQEQLCFLSYFQRRVRKERVAEVDSSDIQDHCFPTSNMLVSCSFPVLPLCLPTSTSYTFKFIFKPLFFWLSYKM